MNITERMRVFLIPPLNEKNVGNTKELYRELLKMSHPDMNPHLPNATRIAQELNAVKDNWYGLVTLGIKYGLIRRGPMKPEKNVDITV